MTRKQKFSIALLIGDLFIAVGGFALFIIGAYTRDTTLFALAFIVFVSHHELAKYRTRDYQENR